MKKKLSNDSGIYTWGKGGGVSPVHKIGNYYVTNVLHHKSIYFLGRINL